MKVTNNIQEPEILNRTILWKLNRLGYLKLLFLGKRNNRKQQKNTIMPWIKRHYLCKKKEKSYLDIVLFERYI